MTEHSRFYQEEMMSLWVSSNEMEERQGNNVIRWLPSNATRTDAELEAQRTRLVREYGVEAPFVHGVVEEGGRIGVEFDRAIGPSFTQWIIEHPNWLRRLTEFFAHEHHEVHMHKVPELPRLKDVLSKEAKARDGLGEKERAQLLEGIALMPDGDWLCHMGFVPDSIIVSIDGPVVYGWGGAARGDYLADVAMTTILLERWRPRPEEREAVEGFRDLFRFGYASEYIKICGRSDDELEGWRNILLSLL